MTCKTRGDAGAARLTQLLRHSAAACALLSLANGAAAGLIDFAAMANGADGESAWDVYTYTDPDGFELNVTGYRDGGPAYAYMDTNIGGMGVCYTLNAEGELVKNTQTGTTTNLCDPSTDDSINTGEELVLVFSEDVTIDTMWFNNFHDGDMTMFGDSITIDGDLYTFDNGDDMNPSYTTSSYFVAAGTEFSLGYVDENFYLQSMQVSLGGAPVPVPATLPLFGLGLVCLALGRRRSLSA